MPVDSLTPWSVRIADVLRLIDIVLLNDKYRQVYIFLSTVSTIYSTKTLFNIDNNKISFLSTKSDINSEILK